MKPVEPRESTLSRCSTATTLAEAAKRRENRYKVREVNHIFDIVNAFFYIARIAAGWFSLGGENVRDWALRQGQRETLQQVFLATWCSRCQGSQVANFLPS